MASLAGQHESTAAFTEESLDRRIPSALLRAGIGWSRSDGGMGLVWQVRNTTLFSHFSREWLSIDEKSLPIPILLLLGDVRFPLYCVFARLWQTEFSGYWVLLAVLTENFSTPPSVPVS
jgi:hypothetical protein